MTKARMADPVMRAPAFPVPAPVIRWVGGKSRIAAKLCRWAPRVYRRYIEPFLGSGAMYFRLRPVRAILSDACGDLVEMYIQIRATPTWVHAELDRLTRSKADYYAVRAAWNADRVAWPAARRAATFLYLNHAGYNGLWRVNAAGKLNVPAGRPARGAPRFPQCGALEQVSAVLTSVDLTCCDYAATIARARAGDFLYVDPPYLPLLGKPSFVKYGALEFGLADHERLADAVHAALRRGAHVMVSHVESRVIRRLYRGFRVHKVGALRSISAVSSGRATITELVLVGSPA